METFSHDSVLNFLVREDFAPIDLFNRVKEFIELEGGTLSVDDSILDKPYSQIGKTGLVGRHYSGKHHQVVQGICLVTLFYTDKKGVRVPVNYRIYQQDGIKTKNVLFREMLEEVLSWQIKPAIVTGDSWYSGLDNLKLIRKHKMSYMFAVEKDRLISTEKGVYENVGKAPITQEGLFTHLKGFGMLTVFRVAQGEQNRHYIYYEYHQEQKTPKKVAYDLFEQAHQNHWHIEEFHRAMKQVCNVEHFLVRRANAIKTHIFSAFWAFITLEIKVINKIISHWYQWRERIENNIIKANLRNIA